MESINKMEQHRRRYINQLNLQIKDQETYQKQNCATIERFRNSNATEFTRNKLSSLKGAVEKSERNLEELKKEVTMIRSGSKDEEIRQKVQCVQEASKKHVQEKLQRKKEKQAVVENQKKKAQKRYSMNRRAWKNDRQKQRDYRYGYKRFCKIVSSIPDYLEKNLKGMPNNKGYIFRGVWLLGRLPAEPRQARWMFERKNKNLLLIHEITETEIKIWEKKGKGRKTLFSTQYRKKKKILN